VLVGCLAGQPDPDAAESAGFLQGKKVAVTVFAQNDQAKGLTKTAQSRIEEVMADNDVAVLDEQKAHELNDIFKTLEDPGAFVTAETFVENAKKFDIQGILAVYTTVEVVPGLADYFSATAHADIRFVDSATAKVRAISTPPMGIRGAPPSDGLTSNSAAMNAVQRAVDSAARLAGFEIAELTRAKSVDLALSDPTVYADGGVGFVKPDNEQALWDLASLEKQTWRTEEVTCTARAPAGGLAAVAGYIKDTNFRRRPERLYGSRVHIVDVANRKRVLCLDCSPVEMKSRQEPNTKQVLALTFVRSWRHLCAVTGNHVHFWDVERGVELARVPVPEEPTALCVVNNDREVWIVIRTKKGSWKYPIIRPIRQ